MNIVSMYKRYHKFTKWAAILSGASIFALMAFISTDVILRNFAGSSISGSFEIVENYFMPLAVFPALAWVYSSGIMPRMDLLINRIAEGLRKAIVHFLVLIEIVVVAVVTWYSLQYALAGLDRSAQFTAGGESLPLWPAQFVAPLGFGLLLIELLFVMARNVRSNVPSIIMKGGT